MCLRTAVRNRRLLAKSVYYIIFIFLHFPDVFAGTGITSKTQPVCGSEGSACFRHLCMLVLDQVGLVQDNAMELDFEKGTDGLAFVRIRIPIAHLVG